MPLTEMIIKNTKATDKAQRLFDGGGLYLEVAPSGGKLWRLKYRVDGREKRLSLGVYPTTTLKEARTKREDAKRLLANGIDPGAAKKAEKESSAGTFEAIAREWLSKYSGSWSPGHSDKILRRLERDIFPWLGQRPINQITPPELLTALRRVRKGALSKQPIELWPIAANISLRHCHRPGRARHQSGFTGSHSPGQKEALGQHH